MNLAAIMERADKALLPAVYQEVGLPGTRLGTLTLYRLGPPLGCRRLPRRHRPGPFPADPTLSSYKPFFILHPIPKLLFFCKLSASW